MRNASQDERRLQILGDRLDGASIGARDLSHSWWDYEDENGDLQHDTRECPCCREHRLADLYFYHKRRPWLEKYRKLGNMPSLPTDGETLPKLWRAVLAARENEERVFALGDASTWRQRIDAECLTERAEGIYEQVYWRWGIRMYEQQQKRLAMKRERT